MATGLGATETKSGISFDELHRLTVDDYERLAEAGVLDDPQVELINGWLVRKKTKKPRHAGACDQVAGILRALLPAGWYIREQNPLRIPDYDEPEPDLAVVRGSGRDYTARHPGPADVALVIEVADTSLARDRGGKRLAYGTGGVPVYWIVNLLENQLEVYSDPERSKEGYARCVVHEASGSVRLWIDGAEVGRVAVGDFLAGDSAG